MKKDSIGNRMKENYESRYKIKLTRRTPVIIRLDGKAFHTLTKTCNKPFDSFFSFSMLEAGLYLCNNIQGAKCAYVQSDEISILLTDFDKLTTDAWFDYNIQKMTSVSASMASVIFSKTWFNTILDNIAVFDSRVFNVPKEEVCNYFIWRQLDWIRNSLQMLAKFHYSHKELQKKNQSDMHEMLYAKGVNWTDLDSQWKNGRFIYKNNSWVINNSTIFKEERESVERYLTDNEVNHD